MYKRRIKTIKTSIGGGSLFSSQSSTSTVTSRRSPSPPPPPKPQAPTQRRSPSPPQRPVSPKDIFDSETASELLKSPSPKKAKLSQSNGSSEGKTTKEVLEMLMSSQEGSPLKRKKTSSWAPSDRPPVRAANLTFMEEAIREAGMILTHDGESPNILLTDQAVFVRDISKVLTFRKSPSEIEKCTDKFVENMETYFSDLTKLKFALSPTKTDSDSNTARGEIQDPLIRLLLCVDELQVKLIDFLMLKIAEFTSDDNKLNNEESIGWVRLILQPLRYLNKIIDSAGTTQKLFDIIHMSTNIMVHHEVINCIPDIVTDEQHETVSNELIELMRSEESLTPSILMALESLCQEADSLYNIQIGLIKSLRKAPLNHIPAFVKFIIKGDSLTHRDELINGLRNELILCLPASSCSTQNQYEENEIASTQVLVFDKIRDALLTSRKLADAWIKNISKIKTIAKHTPLDIAVLLILYASATDVIRKRALEMLFKSKVRSGLFTEFLIKDTFTTLKVIVKQFFKDLLKIASVLLLAPDLAVSKYGAFIYMESFSQMDTQWCKMILLEMTDLVRMYSHNAKAPLALLHSLTSNYCNKVSPFVTLIMLLLDSVTELSVFEVRQLMDILCMIAFSDPDDVALDMTSLQDEIYMLVQKQLACPDLCVFRCGIVCAVMAIKHMVTVKEGVLNETPDADEENIVLSRQSKKAFNLLEMVLVGTRSNSEAQVLSFDQLSHIIMCTENLDKAFVKKVSILMQSSLQNYYIIASSDFKAKNDDLEASLQLCIDNDIEDPIVLNLTNAVERELSGSPLQMPCVALPGLIRVVRGLEIADLTEIDALLGCALSLPNPSLFQHFGTQDPHLQNLLMHCLFHAVNWFREVVNCFVYLIKEGKPEKILMRMRTISHFQNLISTCLPQAISYSPPNYYLNLSPTKAPGIEKLKRGGAAKRKTKKKKEDKEEGAGVGDESRLTGMPGTSAGVESGDEEGEKDEPGISVEITAFRSHLRELDFDVCLILTQPLTLTPKPFKEGVFSPEFGPCELMLLMDDLASKLKFSLGVKHHLANKTHPVGFDNLSTVPIELIIRNFSKLSQHITGHLQKLVEFSHNLINIHDGIWDAPGMFAPGTSEVKQCTALILQAFNTYLSWPDFKSEVFLKFLINTVSNLGGHSGKNKLNSLTPALEACTSYLSEISKCMLDLPSAVSLVSLIGTVLSHRELDENKLDIDLEKICESYLNRRWYDTKGNELKGPEVNRLQTNLLTVYLCQGDNALNAISYTLTWLVEESHLLGNDSSLTTFPHFNKNNLNILVQTLCKGLVIAIKKDLDGKDFREQLKLWENTMSSLQELVAVIKAQDSKINLRHFLKGCLPILKLFLSQGMEVCSTMFKMESVLVSQLLKKLQLITRYIQNVCNFSKVSKDSSMIQQLPVVRGVLESIVLAVKNMVLKNKCTDAFFMGSMKNKDLKGEVIASQEDSEDTTVAEPNPAADEDQADESDNRSDNEDTSTEAVSDII